MLTPPCTCSDARDRTRGCPRHCPDAPTQVNFFQQACAAARLPLPELWSLDDNVRFQALGGNLHAWDARGRSLLVSDVLLRAWASTLEAPSAPIEAYTARQLQVAAALSLVIGVLFGLLW